MATTTVAVGTTTVAQISRPGGEVQIAEREICAGHPGDGAEL
jgi:hypothetical protein